MTASHANSLVMSCNRAATLTGIAERREHDMLAKADVPDDHVAAVDADAVAYRLLPILGEIAVQLVHVGGNPRQRVDRLPARDRGARVEAEQRQYAVADELVGLPARLLDRRSTPP